MIEFSEDAIALRDPRLGKPSTGWVQSRLIEKIGTAVSPRLPDWPVPCCHGKVGAAEAGTFGSQHRVRASLVAETGSRFDAVDAIAPIANPEPEVGLFHQETNIGLDVAVAGATAELRAGGNHAPTLAGKRRRRQNLFQGGSCFLLSMPVNQLIKRKVGSDIPAIGHGPRHMPEVRLKRVQASAVAFSDEAGKCLAALMGVQMPALTLVFRHVDKWREQSVQSPQDRRQDG